MKDNIIKIPDKWKEKYEKLPKHSFFGPVGDVGDDSYGSFQLSDIKLFREVYDKVNHMESYIGRCEGLLKIFLENNGIKPGRHLAIMLGQLMKDFTLLLPSVKYKAIKTNLDGIITNITDIDTILPFDEAKMVQLDGYWEIDPVTKKPFYNQKRYEEDNLL